MGFSGLGFRVTRKVKHFHEVPPSFKFGGLRCLCVCVDTLFRIMLMRFGSGGWVVTVATAGRELWLRPGPDAPDFLP